MVYHLMKYFLCRNCTPAHPNAAAECWDWNWQRDGNGDADEEEIAFPGGTWDVFCLECQWQKRPEGTEMSQEHAVITNESDIATTGMTKMMKSTVNSKTGRFTIRVFTLCRMTARCETMRKTFAGEEQEEQEAAEIRYL